MFTCWIIQSLHNQCFARDCSLGIGVRLFSRYFTYFSHPLLCFFVCVVVCVFVLLTVEMRRRGYIAAVPFYIPFILFFCQCLFVIWIIHKSFVNKRNEKNNQPNPKTGCFTFFLPGLSIFRPSQAVFTNRQMNIVFLSIQCAFHQ